jgi:hypothetical protein
MTIRRTVMPCAGDGLCLRAHTAAPRYGNVEAQRYEGRGDSVLDSSAAVTELLTTGSRFMYGPPRLCNGGNAIGLRSIAFMYTACEWGHLTPSLDGNARAAALIS